MGLPLGACWIGNHFGLLEGAIGLGATEPTRLRAEAGWISPGQPKCIRPSEEGADWALNQRNMNGKRIIGGSF